MDVGIMFSNTGGFVTPDGAARLGRVAEAEGFESVWTVEHVIFPEQYESEYPYSSSGKMAGDSSVPLPDPLIWLTWVAAHTSTLNLGTGILILPQRNPLVLAKEAASLDVLSGGRLRLGIGVGWLEEEFDALGVPFADRGHRADEYVDVLHTLWEEDNVSFQGEFVEFDRVAVNPKPVQGRVPIVVGGHSMAAARRAGLLGDGFFPGKGSPKELADLFDVARQTAEDAGRDPEALEFTAGSRDLFGDDPVGAAQELASLGVSRVMVPSFMLYQPSVEEATRELAERIVEPLRAITPG
jgi:probable F420-dependent oxidoreductase